MDSRNMPFGIMLSNFYSWGSSKRPTHTMHPQKRRTKAVMDALSISIPKWSDRSWTQKVRQSMRFSVFWFVFASPKWKKNAAETESPATHVYYRCRAPTLSVCICRMSTCSTRTVAVARSPTSSASPLSLSSYPFSALSRFVQQTKQVFFFHLRYTSAACFSYTHSHTHTVSTSRFSHFGGARK